MAATVPQQGARHDVTLDSSEYLTLEDIARKLRISKDSARRMFSREPGILRLNAAGKSSTRNGRVRLRIPVSVYDRVVNRLRHAS
jgi:hypothetical protein